MSDKLFFCLSLFIGMLWLAALLLVLSGISR
jgi:hypothetical protein